LVDAAAILDLWAEEERVEPEQQAMVYLWMRSPRELPIKLRAIPNLKARWAVGGVTAANLYAPTLTADPIPDVWVSSDVPFEKVADVLRGEIVPTGANLRLMQTGGDPALHHAGTLGSSMLRPNADEGEERDLIVVSGPRAYVEARASTERGPEVAQNVRALILGRTDSNTARGPST
jgi:hypothetical protein